MAGDRVRTVTLRDGRELAVSVSGEPGQVPLVWHHGTPGCLLQSRSTQQACAARGLAYVSYTRAGAQGSTRNPGRTVADVAADIEDVLDALGADRCVVAGKSGGGPHALATAALLGDRVAAVASVAGLRPYAENPDGYLDGMGQDNLDEFALALEGEDALRPFAEHHAAEMREADAAGMVADLATLLPEVDREVLTDEVGTDMVEGMRGGVQVIDGWIDDDLAFVRPWGFDLADIAVPTYVWQGSEDLMVPFSLGQWLAARIPGAVAHLEQGQGHFSIVVGAMDRMLAELARHL